MTYTTKMISLLTAMLGMVFLAGSVLAKAEPTQTSNYTWKQTDNSIALLNPKGTVWQFNYKKQEAMSYFHPLSLPDGTELTRLQPPDHRWHWGLWFSWKYINGINYWDPEQPKGQTEVVDVNVECDSGYRAQIHLSIEYHPPEQPVVLTEKRTLVVNAPDENGSYTIDWTSVFTTGETDVLLDRTPVPGEKNGVSYGGYAGLSLRMAKHMKGWQFTSNEGPLARESRGNTARWVDFSGQTADGKYAGVTIVDHPDNLRYPSTWWLSAAMPYFSPAPLFTKPYTLVAGETLTLRYRILVHAGPADRKLLETNKE